MSWKQVTEQEYLAAIQDGQVGNAFEGPHGDEFWINPLGNVDWEAPAVNLTTSELYIVLQWRALSGPSEGQSDADLTERLQDRGRELGVWE